MPCYRTTPPVERVCTMVYVVLVLRLMNLGVKAMKEAAKELDVILDEWYTVFLTPSLDAYAAVKGLFPIGRPLASSSASSRILECKGEEGNDMGEMGFVDEVMMVSDDVDEEAFRSRLSMNVLEEEKGVVGRGEGCCWRRWKQMLGVLTVFLHGADPMVDAPRVERERVPVPDAGVFGVSGTVRVGAEKDDLEGASPSYGFSSCLCKLRLLVRMMEVRSFVVVVMEARLGISGWRDSVLRDDLRF
ncbi:uncharacterized protein HKW66_Vig0237400 [Vigna angularis]|uniref:Uncharacterized protein n=1 Tax=Phaseolus angularis TaxID=3914 RepID=A0A8T0KWB6_PHAAN|nr:uncharacterized protein HKW66_Vig0237400 [Vigna angularis]